MRKTDDLTRLRHLLPGAGPIIIPEDDRQVLAAALEERERLREALDRAAVHLEILTARMRGCHEETGQHELLGEAEAFCAEAREALIGG